MKILSFAHASDVFLNRSSELLGENKFGPIDRDIVATSTKTLDFLIFSTQCVCDPGRFSHQKAVF